MRENKFSFKRSRDIVSPTIVNYTAPLTNMFFQKTLNMPDEFYGLSGDMQRHENRKSSDFLPNLKEEDPLTIAGYKHPYN
jgi:hypothetical protein